MEKKRWRINLFDIVIILVVLCLGIALYAFTHKTVVVETKKVTYQLEMIECPEGFAEKIHVGDKLTDNIKNYHMGTVVAVEAEPATKLGDDRVNGAIVERPLPGLETIKLTVEANVTESNSDLKVDGGYVVKAGKEIAVKGNGYAGKGYILTVNR